MIVEGLKLMVLGMVIVYIFLILLMVMVYFSSRVFKGHAMATPSAISPAKKAEDDLIAILSAAISAYRNRNKKK